ncbi:hypothetical protein JCM10213v2_003055 [Rhodosporidiobolus nylandii]
MLDRLPVELLSLVLRLAAPLDYTPELYKERRATLRSCCLVSRPLRELAQPMLAEVAAVRNQKDVKELAVEREGRSIHEAVELLAVHKIEETVSPGPEFCPRVTELRFYKVGGVGLDNLGTTYGNFMPVFPNLVELSLGGVIVPPDVLDSLLSLQHTPSLRILGITSVQLPNDTSDIYLPEFPDELLSRLDILGLDLEDGWQDVQLQQLRSKTTLLVDCELGESSMAANVFFQSLPLFVRFYLCPADLPEAADIGYEAAVLDDALNQLERTTDLVSNLSSPPHIKVLILPSRLPFPFAANVELALALKQLATACEEKGIEVKRDDLDWTCQSLIPPWLARRAKLLKRDRAEGAGAGGKGRGDVADEAAA